MNSARRTSRRRDWPRGLYEPRPGYFVWRSLKGKTYPIGRVPLAVAKAEANAANLHEQEKRPSLVERLSGAVNTVADLLDEIKDEDASELAHNTLKTRRMLDKRIRVALGDIPCGELTVKHCADALTAIKKEGKLRLAEAVRTRLVQLCRKGMALGWMDANPADVTDAPKVKVKRKRLTLEAFWQIYEQAPKVAPWLQKAMMLGLVLGAARLEVANLKRSDVIGAELVYRRQKTGAVIAVPLALRMEAAGVSLADLVNARGPVLSPYLVHHQRSQGQAKAGDPVHPDQISAAFTQARRLAGIPDDGAPTFHETRSLSKRTYTTQGGVDTKALLGHAGERVSDLYADPRGAEPIRVRLG